MPSNTAAWLLTDKQNPLVVQHAEYTRPGENEVVIKNAAVALNPVDCTRQDVGSEIFKWTTYPTIIGTDLAGAVVEVGPNVTKVKPGDRVLGMSIGLMSNRPADAAFQAYSVLPSSVIAKIPESLTYEDAASIPLGASTAACGLFQQDFLALDHPTTPPRPSNGKTILIWGGSTSVGTNAIQLAIAAGYEVITTASPRNHDYLRKLGAKETFDYHSDAVVDQIVQAFRGRESVGAIAVGVDVGDVVAQIVDKIGGNKFVGCTNRPPSSPPSGVTCKFIFGSTLKDNEVGPALYDVFLPQALANGTFVASPPVKIVGSGLDSIQTGLDELRSGVSLQKLVVSLP